MGIHRRLYRGGRSNLLARLVNRGWAAVYAAGIVPNYLVTLEVKGRRSGRIIRFPLVMVVVEGKRFLVSMLGENANWVRNLKAANNEATLHHGRREDVRLEEIEPSLRAPLLKAYLQRAPGARPHLPIDKDSPLAEFEKVASRFPVFRVVPMERGMGVPMARRPSVQPPVEPRASRTASWRSLAVFAIKLVHSLIFLSNAASILQVFYAGITNRSSRWTRFSLALAVGECLIFAGNRFRCPLTGLAESFGAESGQVTDIFLPRWLADRIPWIFTPPLVAGILALLWHHRHPAGTGTSPRQKKA